MGFPSSTTWTEVAQCESRILHLDFSRIKQVADLLKKSGVPCLVAWAADDHLIQEFIFQDLADSLPIGPRLKFSDGGHNIQKTKAEEVSSEILQWVQGMSRL